MTIASNPDIYPHWVQVDKDRYVSEEQRDGVPDFILVRDKRGRDDEKPWALKWRTRELRERGNFLNGQAIQSWRARQPREGLRARRRRIRSAHVTG